jgi:hypothetical protein
MGKTWSVIKSGTSESMKRTLKSKWFGGLRITLYVLASVWVVLVGFEVYLRSELTIANYDNVLTVPAKVTVEDLNTGEDYFITKDLREVEYSTIESYIQTPPKSDAYHLYKDNILAVPMSFSTLIVLGLPFYALLVAMCLFTLHILNLYSGKGLRFLSLLFIVLLLVGGLVTSRYAILFKGYGDWLYITMVVGLTIIECGCIRAVFRAI